LFDKNLLIIASENQSDTMDFLNELQYINNEQSNTIRYLIKSQSGSTIRDTGEEQLLNEVTLLNNELVNLQREISRKNEELSRYNEMKNRFLGMAAHDLRNPIGVICSYTEFLSTELSGKISETHQKFLDNIYKSASFSLSIIEDLLDISKIESGKLELKINEFDILQLISENIYLNRIIADKKNILIHFEPSQHSIRMNADLNKIQQVLNNLITNAIKFSFPNTSIWIKMILENGAIVIKISDSGQGIAPEKLDKIFLPFEKAAASGTQGEKSTGLGLAIVKRIVEGHHGKITVSSEVGKGTEFCVRLPLNQMKKG
jgi:signal transduction histidine kinase